MKPRLRIEGFLFEWRHEKLETFFCRRAPNSLYNLTLLLTNEFRDELALQCITQLRFGVGHENFFRWPLFFNSLFGGFSSWSKVFELSTHNVSGHEQLKRIMHSQNQTWIIYFNLALFGQAKLGYFRQKMTIKHIKIVAKKNVSHTRKLVSHLYWFNEI